MNCPTRRWVASGAWPPRRFPFRSARRRRRSSCATRTARSRRSTGSPPMPAPSWSRSSATTARTSSTSARRSRRAPASGRRAASPWSASTATTPTRTRTTRPRRWREEIAEHGYTFPYLIDEHAGGRQGVRRGVHARPVPVRRRPASRLPRPVRRQPARQRRTPVTGDDLAAAVDAVLAGDAGARRPAPERRLQHQVEARQRAGLSRTRSLTEDRPGVAAEHGDAASADDRGHPRVDGHTG